MDLRQLFNTFLNALASGVGTFIALRAGGWFVDGRKPVKRLDDKPKENGK